MGYVVICYLILGCVVLHSFEETMRVTAPLARHPSYLYVALVVTWPLFCFSELFLGPPSPKNVPPKPH